MIVLRSVQNLFELIFSGEAALGQNIESIQFTEDDYQRFSARLRENLLTLKQLLSTPGFGVGPGSFGAELEAYIIDDAGRALGRNTEIQATMQDSLLTLELNRFNLEYNLSPVPISGRPFSSSESQLLDALNRMNQAAAPHGGRIVPIGILPTLDLRDFNHTTMTDLPRFHALRNKLREEREGLFRVEISGQDDLSLATDDITLEGAATSFQVHYRVAPEHYADSFNVIQLITPLVLAISANSPIVFGRRLWHESRIPLFKQSIDSRHEERLESLHWQHPARVNFGHGWVRDGAYELFAESVRLYPPLLPLIRDPETPHHHSSEAPGLSELRLHQGTIWLWNRPVYDEHGAGHLRIEMRALPSGPSVVDMMANAALMIGLVEGLRGEIRELITALPFRHATHNFYRAAQQGIETRIIWPSLRQSEMVEKPARELIHSLLPVAEQGLQQLGIESNEISHYLGVIQNRVDKGVNGASWQLQTLAHFQRLVDKPEALRRMLALYYEESHSNRPVSEWLSAREAAA